MSPKEKAIELHEKYWELWRANHMYPEDAIEDAKTCALIAVDEMIEIASSYEDALSASQTSDYPEFLKEVKQEIEKL